MTRRETTRCSETAVLAAWRVPCALWLLCFALLTGWSPVAEAATSVPNPADIAQAGISNYARLRTEPATALSEIESLDFGVFLLRTDFGGPATNRWLLSARVEESASIPILEILELGNVWYVKEGSNRFKCRPFEAAFHTNVYYSLLASAHPVFCNRVEDLKDATVEAVEQDLVHYRIPLVRDGDWESAITRFDNMDSEIMTNPRRRAKVLERREAATKDGVPMTVNRTTGLVVEQTGPDFVIKVLEFRFLSELPAETFQVPVGEWTDYTRPPSFDALSDCVLVHCDPAATRILDDVYPDSFLLDLRSRQWRRLPLPSGFSVGCDFFSTRRKVLVTWYGLGMPPQLAIVDLELGRSEPAPLEGVDLLGAVGAKFSPDGRRLAFLRFSTNSALPGLQLMVADWNQRTARPVGAPGPYAGPFSWRPDGQAVILKRFLPPLSPLARELVLICQMDMKGEVTDLGLGDDPVVLPKSGRILFHGPGFSEKWSTCNLEGKDIQQYADGMKDYAQPAVSPDEQRILWTRFDGESLPKVYLFEFGSTNGVPVADAPGYAGLPLW